MRKRRRNPHNVRVVITGLGTINPLGNNVKEYWDNLIQGKSGIRLAQHTDLSDYDVKIAGEIDLPDLSEYFPEKKMLKRLDRYVILAHVAGTQAIRDSGIDIDKAPHRYGALIGSGDGGVMTRFDDISKISQRGMRAISSFYCVNTLPSTGAGYLAQKWNLQGPCFSVSSACATSNHALGIAASLIKMGMADAIFAGGSETLANIIGIGALGNIFALSERNESPQTASRPFDKYRDGFVLGEGAGVLCLEELGHAQKRGAHIYAEFTGFGCSCDAYDMVAPHPEGRGAALAMQFAMEDAGLAPKDINLINAHGTSTPLGDQAESAAINKIFREHATKVPVHSTKSMIGHLIGAAGAVEAIAAILALDNRIVHPTINQFEQDPEINLNVVKDKPVEIQVEHILSNSFGFGGQNACVVISAFRE
ncbi:MAG: beta-ketoacyl-ACP synthase II [Chloroflexota bacterium]|nr:beta-ketoacyl-ACP synthase II [Chloroflexota bacterium]